MKILNRKSGACSLAMKRVLSGLVFYVIAFRLDVTRGRHVRTDRIFGHAKVVLRDRGGGRKVALRLVE